MTLVKGKAHVPHKTTQSVPVQPAVPKSPSDPRNGSIRRYSGATERSKVNRAAVSQSRPAPKKPTKISRKATSPAVDAWSRSDTVLLTWTLFASAWFFLTIGVIITKGGL